jgi:hypothetical protein
MPKRGRAWVDDSDNDTDDTDNKASASTVPAPPSPCLADRCVAPPPAACTVRVYRLGRPGHAMERRAAPPGVPAGARPAEVVRQGWSCTPAGVVVRTCRYGPEKAVDAAVTLGKPPLHPGTAHKLAAAAASRPEPPAWVAALPSFSAEEAAFLRELLN